MKKLGGRKEICPTFSDCARVVKKKFPEKLSKIVVEGGVRSDFEKFLLDSIFPTKLKEFPTKLTEFVPFIFITSQFCPTVKRIFPDWLGLPNKLHGGCPPPPPPGTPMSVNKQQRLISHNLSYQNTKKFSMSCDHPISWPLESSTVHDHLTCATMWMH